MWQSYSQQIDNQLCLQDGLSPGISLVLVTVARWPACLTDLPAPCGWLPSALSWALYHPQSLWQWQKQLHFRQPGSLVTGLDSQSVSPLNSETKTGPPSLAGCTGPLRTSQSWAAGFELSSPIPGWDWDLVCTFRNFPTDRGAMFSLVLKFHMLQTNDK